MKREDITGIFAEATKEQIDQLLNLNSADITKALSKQKDDLTEAKQALSDAQATISELEKNKGDVTKLQEQIDAYKEADAQRKQQEAEAQAKAELEARFNAVSGEKKYIHDMVKEGVMRDFGAALKDKANVGKGDKEIFEALTKDKGYFASQNPPGGMGGVDDISDDDASALSDAEYYAKIFNKDK